MPTTKATCPADAIPSPWEIWLARFDFQDRKGYKYRPVLVLSADESSAIVAKVTSSFAVSYDKDYVLEDWEAEGLSKPSIARLGQIVMIPLRYLGHEKPLGCVTQGDRDEIRKILGFGLQA